jgi:hypothetical protein
VEAALARWEAAGLSDAQLSVLRNTSIHIADFLDAPRLGVESDGEIWLNADAAGWGWFTDASAATPAAERMDLLTVVEHEFGHVLFGVQNGTGLMAATLDPGVRLLPSAASLGLDQQPAAGPANLAAPAPSLAGPRDVAVSPTGFTASVISVGPAAAPTNPAVPAPSLVVGVSPPAGNPPAAVLETTTSQVTRDSVLIPTRNEQRAVAVPVPAYAVASADAGRLLAPTVLRSTAGQAAVDALDLLFGGGDALQREGAAVPFAGDHATPFDAGSDLSPAGEDAGFDQVCDWLFGRSGGALTDTADALEVGALNPAAAVAMMVGLAVMSGVLRGDRSRELETRTRRPLQA